VICEVRKARRHCPGVRGDICSICCGTERENTVDCPFDCPYLLEAREREPKPEYDPKAIPNGDIRVPERFLSDQRETMLLVMLALHDAIFETQGAIDYDVREAIEALIRTYRTLQSGLVYETRPNNLIAASIYDGTQDRVAERRKQIAQESGVSVRDADILGALVLLQRMEYRENNGRKRSRAFIQMLYKIRGPANVNPAEPSVIL